MVRDCYMLGQDAAARGEPAEAVAVRYKLLGANLSRFLDGFGVRTNPARETLFDRCVRAVKERGSAYDPKAVCAAAGRRKYGQAEMTRRAVAGRQRASRARRNPAEFSYSLKRVKGETWGGSGKPMYALEERKGSRLFRRFTGTRDEMARLKSQMLAEAKRRRLVTARLEGRGRRNPAAEAAEAYTRFHGQAPSEYIKVTKRIHYHAFLFGVGKLHTLKIRSVTGRSLVTLKSFHGTTLAANGQAFQDLVKEGQAHLTQLFIEGGDQTVDLHSFGIDPDKAHEVETLGKATFIGYQTVKVHLGSEGGDAVYGHKFRTTRQGDRHVKLRVTRYPDVIYRVLDKQLEFSGGSYEIRAEGIDR